jgi:hypothetical protein
MVVKEAANPMERILAIAREQNGLLLASDLLKKDYPAFPGFPAFLNIWNR